MTAAAKTEEKTAEYVENHYLKEINTTLVIGIPDKMRKELHDSPDSLLLNLVSIMNGYLDQYGAQILDTKGHDGKYADDDDEGRDYLNATDPDMDDDDVVKEYDQMTKQDDMNDEIHSILAEAEGLRHLQDDECYRLGEAVIKAVSALNDDERQELADLIKTHKNKEQDN